MTITQSGVVTLGNQWHGAVDGTQIPSCSTPTRLLLPSPAFGEDLGLTLNFSPDDSNFPCNHLVKSVVICSSEADILTMH